jgi:hypothetical protein
VRTIQEIAVSDDSQHLAAAQIDDNLLPYVVELWTADRSSVEAVVARVQSASLAQAVFNASRAEFPVRFLTLRRGEKVIGDTSLTSDG